MAARRSMTGEAPDVLVSPGDVGIELIFDVSDLLAYFPFNRAPTGVQRVQSEIIESLLASDGAPPVMLCCFAMQLDRWVMVPRRAFQAIIAASRVSNDAVDPGWLATYDDLVRASVEEVSFTNRTVLVNLGASWWLPNYFLQIRRLQVVYGITYVPLVYDMIPVVRPSFCTPRLVTEFIEWLQGLLHHADRYIAISQATRRDLIDVANRLGRCLDGEDVAVLPLDGRPSRPIGHRNDLQHPALPGRLASGAYVLLVSTIEPRKGQREALAAWRHLINVHTSARVPKLVLVGKLGFQGPNIIEVLDRDDTLAERVVVMSDVDDLLLDRLYKEALFTLFPSAYEGWGLPVTEALAHGKVPLVADNSSLPEAGADLAMFFNDDSPRSLHEGLERLIFDRAARQTREAEIARRFSPRLWRDVADQLLGLITSMAIGRDPIVNRRRAAPAAAIGEYHPMSRNRSAAIWPGMGSAEHFRQGTGWHELETWGSWTRPGGGALALTCPATAAFAIAVKLVGLPTLDCLFTIVTSDGEQLQTGRVAAGDVRWTICAFAAGTTNVGLTISSDVCEWVPLAFVEPDGGEGDADEENQNTPRRRVGVGMGGFFVLPAGSKGSALLVETVALGALNDYSPYRRPVPAT